MCCILFHSVYKAFIEQLLPSAFPQSVSSSLHSFPPTCTEQWQHVGSPTYQKKKTSSSFILNVMCSTTSMDKNSFVTFRNQQPLDWCLLSSNYDKAHYFPLCTKTVRSHSGPNFNPAEVKKGKTKGDPGCGRGQWRAVSLRSASVVLHCVEAWSILNHTHTHRGQPANYTVL